jgi:hypothetical protein
VAERHSERGERVGGRGEMASVPINRAVNVTGSAHGIAKVV